MGGVVIDEVFGQPGDVGDAGGAALEFEAAFDQLAGAVSTSVPSRSNTTMRGEVMRKSLSVRGPLRKPLSRHCASPSTVIASQRVA